MRRNQVALTSILAVAAVAILALSGCIGAASAPQTSVAMVSTRDELEAVLGDAMVNDSAALCEWDVWGEAVQTLYLWAVCESAGRTAMSAPVVVHLDVGGHVTAASLPGDGTQYADDVRRLFPPGVQKRIFAHKYDAMAAMERIAERRRRGGFALYLVDEAITAQEMLQADVGELGLEETPIISLDDVVAYDAATHEMQLTVSVYERLGGLEVPVQGLPFVACAGAERIYGGAFWVSYSSLSYEGVVIDIFPAMASDPDRTLRIQLGYPESPELFVGEDPRSHPRILESLEAVNKLR
jgi:hypothetical protein